MTFLFSQYVEVITKYAGVSSGFWPRGTVDADVYTGIGIAKCSRLLFKGISI